MWNKLHKYLWNINSLAVFECNLKTNLFKSFYWFIFIAPFAGFSFYFNICRSTCTWFNGVILSIIFNTLAANVKPIIIIKNYAIPTWESITGTSYPLRNAQWRHRNVMYILFNELSSLSLQIDSLYTPTCVVVYIVPLLTKESRGHNLHCVQIDLAKWR